MKDTIYREDAIKAFKPLPTIEGLGLQPLITVDDAIKILNGLPSAQSEPSQVARDIATLIENEQDMRVMLRGDERMNNTKQSEQKKGKWVEKFDRIIRELGVNCAYNMPSFWCNQGKDYKVIPTKYHKGYMQALADVEERMKGAEE